MKTNQIVILVLVVLIVVFSIWYLYYYNQMIQRNYSIESDNSSDTTDFIANELNQVPGDTSLDNDIESLEEQLEGF